ncbi:MAG: ribosomal L7Ae/L30e/S12e/Gadd45 family protein [Gemmatimonadales bacterium]|nr:ribosomal L7Ae/L30e/S12e/Gadd45 family protein [Gemmatimonadales bacterium]
MNALLGLLGLGLRAGQLVIGVDAVRSALQAGRCACVVLAADAGPRAEEKVGRLARAKGVPLVAGPEAERMGARLGRPPVMAVGIRDRALAEGVLGAAPVGT